MVIEIALLDEVSVRVDGRQVAVGPSRQRCVLAALAVDAGRLVPADRLLDRVWGADTPRRGRAVLHSYISRLRKAFTGALTIAHRSDGYLLTIARADQAVDLLRFRALRSQARSADDDPRRVTLLTEALALWRGEPLTGVSGQWADSARYRWQQEREAAEQDLTDVLLRLGRGEEMVAQLLARTSRHPLDERVTGQYMLALHHAGRTADALTCYRQLRQRLVEELGTDPGTALRELHQRLLDNDTTLTPAPPVSGGRTTNEFVPHQLPAPPRWFIGRDAELARLDEALTAESDGMPRGSRTTSAMVISAIGGAGGIGKTWLSLSWAHQHAERFPDGQLFVDLHGFSPAQEPTAPAVAVRGFLDALGVDPGRVPTDLDAQAALYRSLVAGRRMLIVLDNAATAEQVVPLLPGSPTCTVLITGRSRLASLVDRHSAGYVPLGVLDRADARALLTARLGEDRVTAEQDAVDELVELCGGYPLALSIATRHAADRPALLLTEVATKLRELGLELLDHDTDPAASLPAVLSWSLRRLTDEHRTVFALLGIAPGPDTTPPAVAALTGLSQAHTRKALSVLEDASLVERRPGGRYAMHDLVRDYAATLARDLPDDVRTTALVEVMTFYLHSTSNADNRLSPTRSPAETGRHTRGAGARTFPDITTALAWLDAEHTCLLAAQQVAKDRDRHFEVWQFARSLAVFHYRRGHRHDALVTWLAAAEAAVHLDVSIRIQVLQNVGTALTQLSRHQEAVEQLHRALTLAEEQENLADQASTHGALAWSWHGCGENRQALEHAYRALHLYRVLGKQVRVADALNAVGWCAAHLGEYDLARAHCEEALALHRRHQQHPDGEAATLDSLGFISHQAADHRHAVQYYQESLTLYRTLDNTAETAKTLENIGHPLVSIGRLGEASAAWREAEEFYRHQGRDVDAERVRRRLDNLPSQELPPRP
ncbi:BTAD domain-containing putative transcriptional regulator [Lentzea sp. NPDC059081]|uniref:AfsR/SARP family transcriptional regulator n=1 Tax=Lentzea sp. NPDC059081 TaxID=3346719 RepID=UPI0036A46747